MEGAWKAANPQSQIFQEGFRRRRCPTRSDGAWKVPHGPPRDPWGRHFPIMSITSSLISKRNHTYVHSLGTCYARMPLAFRSIASRLRLDSRSANNPAALCVSRGARAVLDPADCTSKKFPQGSIPRRGPSGTTATCGPKKLEKQMVSMHVGSYTRLIHHLAPIIPILAPKTA